MKTVTVKAGNSNYKAIISYGILADAGELITKTFPDARVVLITDDIVDTIWSEKFLSSFHNIEKSEQPLKFVIPHGENNKTISTMESILEFLALNKITQSDIIVSLGGGVCGDITGFAAALYLRGIQYVQIPTTVLAAADSSVGGKTAVNLSGGKNLAGAFHQPGLVICDPETFYTLSDILISDGMAEIIKHGIIRDRKLFKSLAGENDFSWEDIIANSIAIKAEIVEKDVFDKGERQLLNFGHTIGHGVEKCSNYEIFHGHAVAIGMIAEAKAAATLELTDSSIIEEIALVLKKHNLPTESPFSADILLATILLDKKRDKDKITIIVPKTIGTCTLEKMPIANISKYLQAGL